MPDGPTQSLGPNELAADVSSVLAGYAVSQLDNMAILAPGRQPLSFAGLLAQQNYVRERLAAWDLRRGDAVIVILPKGPEMAVAMAVLPVSATAVPVDPNLSEQEYESLFGRCVARALILPKGQPHAARMAADRAGLFVMDLAVDADAPAGVFELSARNVLQIKRDGAGVGPEMAYILCTSGTTSQRKLIPHSHHKIISYVTTMTSWFRYEPTDVSIHVVPMYFAHGIEAALTVPLLNGTSIVFPDSYRADTFFALLEEFNPTWFTAGFTIHRDILRHVERYKSIVANTRLRFLRSGSGRLEPDEIIRLEQAFDAPVIVGFGSTEAGSITCDPLPPRPDKVGSVGLPTINDVRISDENGQFVQAGEVGEIVVRGPLIFGGYLGEQATNAQLFPNGWFHTGDLGNFDEDGFLYLIGRIKEIINRGGEKISPAEIDGVLESHPAVAEAAAFGSPHPSLGELVLAAVVPVDGVEPDESELRNHVRVSLTPSKVPNKIYFVDHLPRSGNGKLLRQDLRDSLLDS